MTNLMISNLPNDGNGTYSAKLTLWSNRAYILSKNPASESIGARNWYILISRIWSSTSLWKWNRKINHLLEFLSTQSRSMCFIVDSLIRDQITLLHPCSFVHYLSGTVPRASRFLHRSTAPAFQSVCPVFPNQNEIYRSFLVASLDRNLGS